MATLTPYLAFNGNCREAMEFYKTVFGGELHMQTFGEAPMDSAEADKARIMHAQLSKDKFMLMASDGMPDQPVQFGNNVTISVHPESKEETEKYFNKLAEGGQTTMPLSDTFWGAYFGMLTDKYGMPWMFNFQKNEQ